MIKCPHCGDESEENQLVLEQSGYDVVEISLSDKGDILNYDVIDEAHTEPNSNFTCPGCYEDISDKDIITQLKAQA